MGAGAFGRRRPARTCPRGDRARLWGVQWITEWYAYSNGVRKALSLADNERVAGFIYIGTAKEKPDERERPELADIVTSWRP